MIGSAVNEQAVPSERVKPRDSEQSFSVVTSPMIEWNAGRSIAAACTYVYGY